MEQRERRIVVLETGGRRWALPAESVREVVPMAELSRPPGAPPLLEGFLNLGGTPVPVLRLDRLFRLPESTLDPYTHLVLLRTRPASDTGDLTPAALLVDRVLEVRRVPPGSLRPVGENSGLNACVAAQVEGEDGTLLPLLDPARLLLERETRLLEGLRELEAERLRELDGAGSTA